MHYELYIDVFFLVNFMMDYLMLLIEKKILKCSATHGNICIGAVLGSLMTSVIICLPIPYAFIKFMLFHIVVNTVMIRVGLKIKFGKTFLKAIVMLYISGFLLGGVFTYLHQYIRITSLFFAVAMASYYVVLGIFKLLGSTIRSGRYQCSVDLYMNDKKHTVEAIIDTGNGLTDVVTGDPVSILGKSAATELLAEEKMRGIRFIPYHSIGKSEGILPVIRLDKMCVHNQETYWIEKPLIGIAEEEISEHGECKLILNPDIF